MKTLIINASPKNNGNISKMVNEISNRINDKSSYKIIEISNTSIRPCIGCMKCRSLNKCVLPYDDGHAIGEEITNSDNIIIAAPVYWGNMPGTLKILFDRNVYHFMGESKSGIPLKKMKGKNGYIITACTTPYPFDSMLGQSSGLIHSVNEIFKYSGIKIKGKIVFAGTKNAESVPEGIIRKLKRIAINLNL